MYFDMQQFHHHLSLSEPKLLWKYTRINFIYSALDYWILAFLFLFGLLFF